MSPSLTSRTKTPHTFDAVSQQMRLEFQQKLKTAEGLLLLTGAGMGVDSGLATYRGENGSYGQLQEERQGSIFEIMTPHYFREHTDYMWARFRRRIQEFNHILPHEGYQIVHRWAKDHFSDNYFGVTSNIDNFLQRTGFSEKNIYEVHGNIHHWQCAKPCRSEWLISAVEHEQSYGTGSLPTCPNCGDLLRPNVYLFRDKFFIRQRTDKQRSRYQTFLDRMRDKHLLVLEIGSGIHVQSIRMQTRKVLQHIPKAFVVRINPDYPDVREPNWGLRMGAKAALEALV